MSLIHAIHLVEVIGRAHRAPFAIQSDFARAMARAVATAASLGFITAIPDKPSDWTAGRHWYVTTEGLDWATAFERKQTEC